jgi:hypothetical protein
LQSRENNNHSFLNSYYYYIINHIEKFHIFPVNENRFLDSLDLFRLKNSFCILSFCFSFCRKIYYPFWFLLQKNILSILISYLQKNILSILISYLQKIYIHFDFFFSCKRK